jgi:hypothetical protein
LAGVPIHERRLELFWSLVISQVRAEAYSAKDLRIYCIIEAEAYALSLMSQLDSMEQDAVPDELNEVIKDEDFRVEFLGEPH